MGADQRLEGLSIKEEGESKVTKKRRVVAGTHESRGSTTSAKRLTSVWEKIKNY